MVRERSGRGGNGRGLSGIGLRMLLALLGAGGSSAVGQEPMRDVYLLIGQSNMAGRAAIEAEDEGSIDGVWLLGESDRWQPAQNPLNLYSTIRKPVNMQRLSPGSGFAQAMVEASDPPRPIGLVVNAKGGSALAQWCPGTHFYKEIVRRAKAAEQQGGVLKGILWHQGESDRGATDYVEQLAEIVTQLRRDLDAADLPFVAGQLRPELSDFNQRLLRLPEVLPHSAVASSEGLTVFDGVHFDSKSQRELGRRYAKAMRDLQSKK